jgi:hypothetical protein
MQGGTQSKCIMSWVGYTLRLASYSRQTAYDMTQCVQHDSRLKHVGENYVWPAQQENTDSMIDQLLHERQHWGVHWVQSKVVLANAYASHDHMVHI